MALNVFLSWQPDTRVDTNRSPMRDALKGAIRSINGAQPAACLRFEEATEHKHGSPEILRKVSAAAVFVADITTGIPIGTERARPDPDVTFDLGYAVAELGWDRILLCFNQACVNSPNEVPFDFPQHRIYKYAVPAIPSSSELRAAKNHFVQAINAILVQNPKRPFELRRLNPQMIKRERDVANLRWLLSKVHAPTLEDLIESLPHTFTDRSLSLWSGFDEVHESGSFHLHDKVLARAVRKLHGSWRTAVSYVQDYCADVSGELRIFANAGGAAWVSDRQRHWERIDAARNEMRVAWSAIRRRLQSGYPEVDLGARRRTSADHPRRRLK